MWLNVIALILGGGGVAYLIVEKLFMRRSDKADAAAKEVQNARDAAHLYSEIDEIVKSILNEQDWKDIAKAIGEDIQVVGDLAFTNYGISTSGLWNKYKAKPVKSIKPMKVKKFEINDGTEIIDGTEIVVIEDDGLLSFYGKRSCSDLLFLVGYRGSIEEVDNDVAANIAAQYESTISEEEEAIAEALEEKLTEDQ